MAIHLVQIGEVVQLKGIKQRKYGSTDLKMMPIALSVRKGQPMAAVLGRADGVTLQETALVLEGITIDRKPLKDHLEAVGHKDAFLYVQDLVKDKIPFSETIIKQIHTLVLMDRPEDRGIYRRIPVRIMGAYHTPYH